MKKVMQDKIFRVGGGLLLIGIGCIIGMGIIISQIGGSWEHRIKFVENSVTAMVRPVINNIEKSIITEIPNHKHKWFSDEIIILEK